MGLIQDTCGGRFDKDEVAKISFAYDSTRELSSPSFSGRMAQRFSTPSYSQNPLSVHIRDSRESGSNSPHPRPRRLQEVLTHVMPFDTLEQKDLNTVVEKYFEEVRFDQNHVVIRPGGSWDYYYVVLEGTLNIIPHTQQRSTKAWLPNPKGITKVVPITMIPTDEEQVEPSATSTSSSAPTSTTTSTSTSTTSAATLESLSSSSSDDASSEAALVWSFGDAAIWGRSKMADEQIVVTSSKCTVVRMKANHYRGLYNRQLDEKKKDPEQEKNIKIRQTMVETLLSKKGSDCAKLLSLLPSKDTRRNFAVACELIVLDGNTVDQRMAKDDTSLNGVGSSFYMVAVGKCRAGPSGFATSEQKQGQGQGQGLQEEGVGQKQDFKEYVAGQFLEDKCHQDLVAQEGEKCTLLKLHSEQIRLFFATRTCRDAIRVFEGSNDLEKRLEQITCLRTVSAKRRALHSCTHETMTTAIDYGFDIGIHTFQKGQYLLRVGRVASREIDMRTRQCDSFVLKSGRVAIVDPSSSEHGVRTSSEQQQQQQQQQQSGGAAAASSSSLSGGADGAALEIVRPGLDGYVTAYQEEEAHDRDDPRLRCVGMDVIALEDTSVYVVRLHHDKETLGKRFAAFSDTWCCATTDARSGKVSEIYNLCFLIYYYLYHQIFIISQSDSFFFFLSFFLSFFLYFFTNTHRERQVQNQCERVAWGEAVD